MKIGACVCFTPNTSFLPLSHTKMALNGKNASVSGTVLAPFRWWMVRSVLPQSIPTPQGAAVTVAVAAECADAAPFSQNKQTINRAAADQVVYFGV